MSVLDHPSAQGTVTGRETGDAAARRTLRGQVARLERDLVAQATATFPPLPLPERPSRRAAAPRVLSLAELEVVRDDLADRLRELTARRRALSAAQRQARGLLERMLLAPGEHKWVRVTNADLGEPGCKAYHAVPRLGVVGMLAGWWHVKVSSGCPLGVPEAARPPAVLRDAARAPAGGSPHGLRPGTS